MVDKPFIYGAVSIIFELEGLVHAILPLPQGAKHLLLLFCQSATKQAPAPTAVAASASIGSGIGLKES